MKTLLIQGIISAFLVVGVLASGGVAVAQEDSSPDTIVGELQEQIKVLQQKISDLRARLQSGADTSGADNSDAALRLRQQLSQGDRGERVRLLQEFLAQDRSIYPEGLTTGYYGLLTSQAVARLQQQIGVADDGEFNDETMARIKSLIKDGAGNSDITPPGLLRAPGIQRLFGGDVSTAEDNDDNSDDDSDDENEVDDRSSRRGLDIDQLNIPEDLKERLRAIFDQYDIDDDDELEIEVKFDDGEAEVEIDYPDGSEDEFNLDITDVDEVIEEIVSRTSLTEEEIREVIVFRGDELEIEVEFDDGRAEVEIKFTNGTEREYRFRTVDREEVISRIVTQTDLTEERVRAVIEFDEEEDEAEADSNDDDSEDVQ
ncbi:MAG: peptidoglycan-binding domain-containing protein [Candidatus Paceibacterota bacterium]